MTVRFPAALPADWRETATGILVAAPVVTFPFSRLYTLFFVLILLVAVFRRSGFAPLRCDRPLLWASLAIAGPPLITILALPLMGQDFETLWIRKLLTLVVGCLFSLATAHLLRSSPRVVQVAGALISFTVMFWLLDGIVQLTFGRDLFGVPLNHRPGEPPRVGIFFANPLTFGYYIPYFSAFPAIWCLHRPRGRLASLAVLIAAGVITLTAGSRNAMLSYGLLLAVLALLLALQLPRARRLGVLIGMPLVLAGLVAALQRFNESFRSRLQQTLLVLQEPDYDTLNEALTWRLEIWEPAWQLIRSHWLLGIGPNQFRPVMRSLLPADSWHARNGLQVMHAHQVLLEIALGTGVIGVLAFLAYYLYVGRKFWHYRQHLLLPDGFALAGLLCFLLLWFPLGTQKNFYGSDQVFFTFYFLAIGFGVLAPRLAQQDDHGPVSQPI